MVAMHHFFFAVHAYCGRFCAKRRTMAAGYANLPPLYMSGYYYGRRAPRLFGQFMVHACFLGYARCLRYAI